MYGLVQIRRMLFTLGIHTSLSGQRKVSSLRPKARFLRQERDVLKTIDKYEPLKGERQNEIVKEDRTLHEKPNKYAAARDSRDERFYEWLAGIIDGDGTFQLSKKGYASLEITSQLRDKKTLYLIKQKFGGSVKLYSGNNYLRYRLHHKEGLLNLIDKINGLIQNPTRILQLGKICEKYSVELKNSKSLTYYNG